MYWYNSPKHKVFISFYHKDDQIYKDYIDNYLSSNIINKSVSDGEYDSENSDEYIKRLIREDKVSDSSVVVVLVGANTKKRKHVDWEIYAGLRPSVNGCSGLVGIMLPSVQPNYEGNYYYADMPQRLADNLKTGYASLYTWEYATLNFDSIIQDAFNARKNKIQLMDNSRLQMQENL